MYASTLAETNFHSFDSRNLLVNIGAVYTKMHKDNF